MNGCQKEVETTTPLAEPIEHAEDERLDLAREIDQEPVFLVAKGLNVDGSLVENYRRGLNYAIDYFGNYGPYYICLLGPGSESSIRNIYRKLEVNSKAEAVAKAYKDRLV